MNSFIMVWVLVTVPYASQSSPVISLPVADLASCQRMQAILKDSRTTQCVEVKVVK